MKSLVHMMAGKMVMFNRKAEVESRSEFMSINAY